MKLCMWWSFSYIFVNGDLFSVWTWEELALKILRYHHNIRESYHLVNEYSHSDWLTAKGVVMDFKIQRERERQKTVGLISKTTTLHVHHAFLYISFLFLHDYDVKMPNFTFYGGRKQATTKLYFSFWAWPWILEIQLQEGSPTFDKVSR